MFRISLAIGAVLATAVALRLSLGGEPEGATRAEADRMARGENAAGAAAVSADTIRRLEEELRDERAQRLALAERVARLELQLPVAPSEVSAAPENREAEPAERAPRGSPGIGSSFPEARLLEAGFARAEVAAYRERIDQIELDRLFLRDQASREGWLDTPRYAEERAALSQARRDTREEFGDELYDWALFASGRPNRVRVSEVMQGSPAAAAGLEAGDILVRYGERKIFNPRELRQQTLAGDAGAPTEVEILRLGEPPRVFLPRGPLGIRTDPIVREPAG